MDFKRKMDRKTSIPMSEVDSEQYFNYISTAPTTPDGSLTFSPNLQAMRLHDALETASVGDSTRRKAVASLNETTSGTMTVKNICCIGAGYVGKCSWRYSDRVEVLIPPRWPNSSGDCLPESPSQSHGCGPGPSQNRTMEIKTLAHSRTRT